MLAVDTNVAIAALAGEAAASAGLRAAGLLFLPVPVLGELRYGALNSARPADNSAVVERFASQCAALPADTGTATVYAEIRARLKRRGTPIPENDVWIAAICIQHALPLATRDSHFAEVEQLQRRSV
jgi:tRNA(fMet)-specific endonuclease VapC